MGFLNNYKYTDLYNYVQEPEFNSVIKIGNFIYTIGNIYSWLNVLKTSDTGNIIWDWEYYISGTGVNYRPIKVYNVLECDNKDILILLGSQIISNCTLLRIDGNTGGLIWHKTFAAPTSNAERFCLNKIGFEDYLLMYQVNYSGGSTPPLTHLLKINVYGNITQKLQITASIAQDNTLGSNYIDNLITTDGQYIFVATYQGIIKLSNTLQVISNFVFNKSLDIHGIYALNSKVYLTGAYTDSGIKYSFYTSVNYSGTISAQTVYLKCLSNNGFPVRIDSQSIYFTFESDGKVQKNSILDDSFIWFKKISITTENVILNLVGDMMLVVAGANLGLLNSSMDSCETVSENSSNPIIPLPVDIFLNNDLTASATFPVTELNINVFEQERILTKYALCFSDNTIDYTDLQSPHLYAQAAGSIGNDSTTGIHLRWLLKNALTEHLPKGNYAQTVANFNKPDDFVALYRAPYVSTPRTLDFSQSPNEVDNTLKQWTFIVDDLLFYVNFLTPSLYTAILNTIDPGTDSRSFMRMYCEYGGILEVENKNHLSFGITPNFYIRDYSSVVAELLSVEENLITSPKRVSYRNEIEGRELGSTIYGENVRSIRFTMGNTYLLSVSFEFYHDFVNNANDNSTWQLQEEFALTLNDKVAIARLDPDAIDGKWRRYNNNAFVRASNYIDRWYGTDIEAEDSIAVGVQKYIDLSNDPHNPTGTETYYYDNAPVDEQGNTDASSFELSNLNLLQIASLDFHVARMLGLGAMDTSKEARKGSYVYAVAYTTVADLNDGRGAREVKHLYCTLPTSLKDERLPLPVDLKVPAPGIFMSNDIESTESITNPDGYTADGKSRYLTLYCEDLHEEGDNMPFLNNKIYFDASKITAPVYAGIEYKKKGVNQWAKPELSHHAVFQNIDTTVASDFERRETVSIVIPEPGYPLFIHREKQTGWHTYGSYGINWFSRASESTITHDVETIILPENLLLPPSGVNAVLVQPESPLLLTSADEQAKFEALTTSDKTIVRLLFEYNHAQELISYQQKIGQEYVNSYLELSDAKEPFADELEIVYRNRVPGSISGKISSVVPTRDPEKVIITTEPYILSSTQPDAYDLGSEPQSLVPVIEAGTANNYVGSVLLADGIEYLVTAVETFGAYPEFTLVKQVANTIDSNGQAIENPQDYIVPVAGALFLLVENMQNTLSWNTPANTNPLPLKVTIDQTTVHHEDIQRVNMDGEIETYVHKFRGVYKQATISKVYEDFAVQQEEYLDPIIESRHLGLYKFSFPGFSLAQHSQYAASGNSVEYTNGLVRVHTLLDPSGKRKEMKVSNVTLNDQDGVLSFYAVDPAFPVDDEDELNAYTDKLMGDDVESISQTVNYYPGYKVYLYADDSHGLTEAYTLPSQEEDSHYSIFGIRSVDLRYNHRSALSMPALMLARKIEDPVKPKMPIGGPFATRPDFFGKSTYTFTTAFEHRPYSVQFSRASDIQILSALFNPNIVPIYGQSTVDYIKNTIFEKGEDTFYVNRWNNLLSLNYTEDTFEHFPDELGTAIPLPDNPEFITAINNFIFAHNQYYPNEIPVATITSITSLNQVIIPENLPLYGGLYVTDFISDAIYSCFVPLTEIPVIYQYIKGTDYIPLPKKQVVRDRNGNLLNPGDADFDMAPMMKVLSTNPINSVQFTDFGLDGASTAHYFYISREMSLQMQMGPYSDILGPISLVNTKAPVSPDLVKLLSVLENRVLGITPAIQFEINAYAEIQNIKKINIYRTNDGGNSLSVRTMDLVRVIDLEVEGISGDNTWTFMDDFADLPFVPYGDMLYYRITVSRQIKYSDSSGQLLIDYTPSKPTNVIMTNVVNNYAPESPVLSYTSDATGTDGYLHNVVLSWEQTVYNGKYHVYKMSPQGNWVKLDAVISNSESPSYYLGDILVTNDQNNSIYSHFKVIAENYSGMISTQENILTISRSIGESGGIGLMTIESTFIVG